MAQLPPIPEKPSDRLETREEYVRRRSAIALRRWWMDELTNLLRNPNSCYAFLRGLYSADPFRWPR